MGDGGAYISNEELDRLFDEGEVDILQYFDTDNARRPGLEPRTVAIDLPAWIFDAIEQEAAKHGTGISDLIETWIKDRLALETA